MKVSCLQENLQKGLSIVSRAVSSRSTLPVLNNILLATDQSRLKLAATDLTIGITTWIGAKVEEEGTTTVPAKLLGEFVNSLPAERIDMDLTVRTQTLNLKCSRYESNIKGMDAQDFPIIPSPGAENKVLLDPESLRAIISQVAFAAASDESRPVLTGVLARFEDGKVTLAAADGFRLSVRKGTLSQPCLEMVSAIIPARALGELARIASDGNEVISMILPKGRGQVVFRMKEVELVSQLIDGTFPDYQQIIPRSYKSRTILSTPALLKACKQAEIFAREGSNVARLDIKSAGDLEPGSVQISATSEETGSNETVVSATIDGIGLLIATHNSLKAKGGRLRVVNVSPEILNLFKAIRLDRHFAVEGRPA